MRLSPLIRRCLLIAIDAFLLPIAVWLCFWLRFSHPLHPNFVADGNWLLLTAPLVGLPLYAFMGQYKGLTRYVGSTALYRLAGRNCLLICYFMRVCHSTSGSIMAELDSFVVLAHLPDGVVRLHCVIYYSICDCPAQDAVESRHLWCRRSWCTLAAALRLVGNYKIVTFVDDNPVYWRRSITESVFNRPKFYHF